MPTNNSNIVTDLILDDEEQALEAALERGEFEQTSDLANIKQQLEAAAKQYRQLQTAKPVTLRVNQLDLVKIKAKAKRSNIPYQTLLSAVLHDFAEDSKEIKLR